MAKAVPCIVCRGELENYQPSGNQPSGGVEFTSHGHYGSTVFDPMDGTYLAINVCDRCLKDAAQAGAVLIGEPQRPVRRKLRRWNGRD